MSLRTTTTGWQPSGRNRHLVIVTTLPVSHVGLPETQPYCVDLCVTGVAGGASRALLACN